MKAFDKISIPDEGERITWAGDRLIVPDKPIIPVIEGDGIGPDIMRAARRVLDAAVEKVYRGQRKIAWMDVYAGESAGGLYNGDVFPDETIKAIKDCFVALKGPLMTPP